jgi:transcriptional regulator with XRE-family HTH domain
MMSNLSKNLRNLLNKAKLSENELGRRTGVPQQVINRILNGQNANPKLATLTALSAHFMISVSQLISEELDTKDTRLSTTHSGWIEIPLLKWEEIKHFCKKQKKAAVFKESILTDACGSEKLFATKMYNDSMELKFEQGALLIFDSCREPQDKDFVLYRMTDENELSFRQIFFKNNNTYIKCLNPKLSCYRPVLLENKAECLAVLIQSRSNYFEK